MGHKTKTKFFFGGLASGKEVRENEVDTGRMKIGGVGESHQNMLRA